MVKRTKYNDARTVVICGWLESKGFNSVSEFARAAGYNPSNVWKNILGTQAVSIRVLFSYAKAAKVDMNEVISIFYPTEYAEVMHCMYE